MEGSQAREGAYMTVGEVARRAGVTVRSVQYYDQQGILSPSAKGAHNERLYTPADLDRLYCVLCLKYAGLSLGQIREFVAGQACSGPSDQGAPSDDDPLADVFSQAIAQTERDFAALLHRHAVLNSLRQAALDAEHAGNEPDWRAMAADIADDAPVPGEGRHCVVQAWHGVIAEAVGLMRRHEPLDSPASFALARKVAALRTADAHRPPEERFSLLDDAFAPGGGTADGMGPGSPAPAAPDGGANVDGSAAGPAPGGSPSADGFMPGDAFDGLRREMAAYLDRLAAALQEADG